MPRQVILTPDEQRLFDAPPILNNRQRIKYFEFSSSLLEIIQSLRTPTTQVCFLVQLAYFRAVHRFFASGYHAPDVAYASRLLGIADGTTDASSYDDVTAWRHHQLILEHLGYSSFDEPARKGLLDHLKPLIRSQVRPKTLFEQALHFLPARRIEIPSGGSLTALILDAVREHKEQLVSQVASALSPESKLALDALFEKDPTASESLQLQRSRLTLLKRFSHSRKPSKIKDNLNDLEVIRALHEPLREVARALDLSPDGSRYYAHSVIKSQVFQLSRRADPDRHLHLLCFIAHQYFHLQDLLIDVFLLAVQSARAAVKAEYRDQYYEQRTDHRRTVKGFVEKIEHAFSSPLSRIDGIAFDPALSDQEKVFMIQGILRARKEERQATQNEIAKFKQEFGNDAEDHGFYAVLEDKSLSLQSRVAGILQRIPFEGDNVELLAAVRFYQTKNGNVTHTAPAGFLSDQERRLLTKPDGGFRVSLYKALLFLQVADAVRGGGLHVQESYRYRSLDDYLIPRHEWETRRMDLLDQAGLSEAADCKQFLAQCARTLDERYVTTNENILQGRNEFIQFRKDGSFHVRTPKQEDDEDSEALSSFFPQDRYISLVEVLATVNRCTGFLDAFAHWQGKYVKPRPADRSFFAGIIAYGCQIGLGKVARISSQISSSELERTINWYFSTDNISDASDKILAFLDKLRLPQLYRREDGKIHTSSDGQKAEVPVDSLNANYSFKYLGQGKGASAHRFLDERNFAYHSNVISASEKEAHYVVDGLLHNDVVKSDIHSTDTGGYIEALFGVLRMLGLKYAPRIKNVGKQRIYSFRPRKEYERRGYRILPDGTINTRMIEQQWDDYLRFVVTIKLKVATASQLFKRLNSYSRQHPLYSAMKEFGKIDKSTFIPEWADDVTLRQAVEQQLNKGEHGNRFADAVCFGRNPEFQFAEKVEQEMAEGCNRLIRNAIVCWNYLYISQLLAVERNPDRKNAIIKALKAGSIAIWGYLNMHGEIDFSDDKQRDSVGFDFATILAVDVV